MRPRPPHPSERVRLNRAEPASACLRAAPGAGPEALAPRGVSQGWGTSSGNIRALCRAATGSVLHGSGHDKKWRDSSSSVAGDQTWASSGGYSTPVLRTTICKQGPGIRPYFSWSRLESASNFFDLYCFYCIPPKGGLGFFSKVSWKRPPVSVSAARSGAVMSRILVMMMMVIALEKNTKHHDKLAERKYVPGDEGILASNASMMASSKLTCRATRSSPCPTRS